MRVRNRNVAVSRVESSLGLDYWYQGFLWETLCKGSVQRVFGHANSGVGVNPFPPH